ncbi:C2H2-type zinc finger protein [Flectobacillus major]|uniref:C2H2-type zinc finger protein n=1 Tax=Flectobacillus major TaxID=103 RepID=UPI00047E49F5|nr:C2H2-type zinc finger protein [Flectobacillus major]
MTNLSTLSELRQLLQEGLNMQILQHSDYTKVSLQMERLVRTCRLKGVNIFEFLKEELPNTRQVAVAQQAIHQCPVCGKTFSSQAGLTGHGPNRCKGKKMLIR